MHTDSCSFADPNLPQKVLKSASDMYVSLLGETGTCCFLNIVKGHSYPFSFSRHYISRLSLLDLLFDLKGEKLTSTCQVKYGTAGNLFEMVKIFCASSVPVELVLKMNIFAVALFFVSVF